MTERHVMDTETTTRDDDWVAQCPDCSARRLIRRDGTTEQIDGGDFYALHSWSTSGLALGAEIKEAR